MRADSGLLRGAHIGHRGGLVTKRAEKRHTTRPFLSVTPRELAGHVSAVGEPSGGHPEERGAE